MCIPTKRSKTMALCYSQISIINVLSDPSCKKLILHIVMIEVSSFFTGCRTLVISHLTKISFVNFSSLVHKIILLDTGTRNTWPCVVHC